MKLAHSPGKVWHILLSKNLCLARNRDRSDNDVGYIVARSSTPQLWVEWVRGIAASL